MTWDYDLLLVNPPSLLEQPDCGQAGGLFLPERMKITAMNPGILSIATYLKRKSYSVKIVDLSLSNNFSILENELEKYKFKIIGVSCTSAFEYAEFLECVKIAKERSPESLVIGGGQHVGPLGELVFHDSPQLDVLCKYEGEKVVESLLKSKTYDDLKNIPGIIYKVNGVLHENPGRPELINLDDVSPLEYELYPNYKYFTPFIEESRGCPFGCYYCTSEFMNAKKIRIKSADKFIHEVEYAVNLWGNDFVYAFLASNFGMNVGNTLKIAEGLKKMEIKWTTEFRADGPWKSYLQKLYESGFSVANIGMESASPTILRLMNKTKNPEKYINDMESLIKEISKMDELALRINFMFYVGETPQTVRETISFISRNFEGIDSILYTPVFIVYGTKLYMNFGEYEKKFKSKLIHTPYWDKRHLNLCQQSKYFSFEETVHFCNAVEKIFSTEEGWIRSESYHYSQKKEDLEEKLRRGRFETGK